MKSLGTAILVLLLVSGCARAPPAAQVEDYLVDAQDDAPPRFDILRANFTELNGSLVLWVQIQNYAEGLPLLEARMHARTAAGAGEVYARIVRDPEKRTLPQVATHVGRMEDGTFGPGTETCMIPSMPVDRQGAGPWYVLVDLLHNMTGFDHGAKVSDLRLRALDANGTVRDEASHTQTFAVRGGPNPYAEYRPPRYWCPLANEGHRLGF